MNARHFVGNTETVRVKASTLRIHPTAQRALVRYKVNQIKNSLDLDAIGALQGVRYTIKGEVHIWIVDGQHRLAALLEMGLGDWMVEVMIHLDVKDGARASDLFIKLNRRLPVAPYYKFLNAVEAKEEGALAIVEIAASLQLELTHGSRDGALCCVSVLDRVFNFDKTGTALLVTLQVLVEAWGRTASAMEGKLIEGLGVVFHQYNGTLDRASLVKKLSKYPGGAARLIGDSRGLRELTHTTLAKAVAKQVVEVYNNGRRSGKLDPL